MCPNIKELDLSGCENLVQIENSVGRLDRLVAGDKYGLCFSLRISQLSLFRHLGIRVPYVFPSLKYLTFMVFSSQSEMDFILNYCCPVTLETLRFSWCRGVITLPESISRCERLHSLHIEIWEIPRLPRSLRYLAVSINWRPPLSSKSIFHRVSLLNLNLFRNSFCYLPNTT